MAFRIESLWAFISKGPDGDEGLVAMHQGSTWIPLVAADEMRLRILKPIAADLAAHGAVVIKLVRFQVRVDVETLPAEREPTC